MSLTTPTNSFEEVEGAHTIWFEMEGSLRAQDRDDRDQKIDTVNQLLKDQGIDLKEIFGSEISLGGNDSSHDLYLSVRGIAIPQDLVSKIATKLGSTSVEQSFRAGNGDHAHVYSNTEGQPELQSEWERVKRVLDHALFNRPERLLDMPLSVSPFSIDFTTITAHHALNQYTAKLEQAKAEARKTILTIVAAYETENPIVTTNQFRSHMAQVNAAMDQGIVFLPATPETPKPTD